MTTSTFATAVKVSRTTVGWNFGLNRSVMVLKVTVIRVTNTPVFLPIALLCIQTVNKTGLVAIGIVYIATCKRPCSFCQGRDACYIPVPLYLTMFPLDCHPRKAPQCG